MIRRTLRDGALEPESAACEALRAGDDAIVAVGDAGLGGATELGVAGSVGDSGHDGLPIAADAGLAPGPRVEQRVGLDADGVSLGAGPWVFAGVANEAGADGIAIDVDEGGKQPVRP